MSIQNECKNSKNCYTTRVSSDGGGDLRLIYKYELVQCMNNCQLLTCYFISSISQLKSHTIYQLLSNDQVLLNFKTDNNGYYSFC